MNWFIELSRAEIHIKGSPISVNVDKIETFSPSQMDVNQTLIRVNGKEFIVSETHDEIKKKLETM